MRFAGMILGGTGSACSAVAQASALSSAVAQGFSPVLAVAQGFSPVLAVAQGFSPVGYGRHSALPITARHVSKTSRAASRLQLHRSPSIFRHDLHAPPKTRLHEWPAIDSGADHDSAMRRVVRLCNSCVLLHVRSSSSRRGRNRRTVGFSAVHVQLEAARGISAQTTTGESLWQESYYDHVLRDDEEMARAVRYVLENPVRKGLVREFLEYPHSGLT